MNDDRFDVIGRVTRRQDGHAMVTGRQLYSSDISLPNMLQARVLRSPYPHARIAAIDTSEAERLGAVCITPEDVPRVKYNERQVSVPAKTYRDRTVLPDKVRHVGQGVVAVAARTEALADRALDALDVEFESLPAVFDPHEAMRDGAPQLHDAVLLGETVLPIERNIACYREAVEGDVARGLEEADLVVENEFTTGRAYHGQLESKAVVCRPEADGGITVWATAQSIHNTRQLLGSLFDIPLSKINVQRVPIGGSFGSSIQMNSSVAVCVALALKAQKSVKLVLTREEDMYDHCKYPSNIHLTYGVKRDGTLTAGYLKTVVDIGGHNIQAYPLLGCMAGWFVSLYRLPHLKFEGTAVYTNKAPACAMQGYGNPQVTFAVESMMDTIAEELDIDPIDVRLKNYVGLGETFWGQGPTVRSVIRSCGVEEMLLKGKAMVGWEGRGSSTSKTGRFRRGIGVGRGFHTSGTGAPTPGEVIDYSTAMVKINEDGSVDCLTALMCHGGGTLDAGAKMVAEELGVPLDRVGISPSNTRSTGYDVCTHATRGVYCGGASLLRAAQDVKKILFDFASRIIDVNPDALKVRPDTSRGQGVVCLPGAPAKRITVAEVAKTAQIKGWGSIIAVVSHRQVNCPPCFVVNFVEVEVDTATGQIRPMRAVAAVDAGTVINPDLAAGQLEGGLCRGIGLALLEDTTYKPDTGELTCGGYLTDYKVYTAQDMPSLEDLSTFFADTYEPSGPFGAKGVGEAANNATAGAVANAIYNAVGIRLTEAPITPERVLSALTRDAEQLQQGR
ncbi:MAG TPA: carbon monoxide dehydrogenase [Acidobacteria bacterium]|jgi:xanthine dehydrogenase molybdenum-binding subunit|nr:molybdopterin-dependent oxidoreductase [Vicinamibacterales bacterium]HAK55923.1 carbon monoxide dehydrogenase [Acidobacteriota bacterium]|tara:strand:- start:744 stop:3107 length:2364 start_codon:yes stop_codon:yes gene_type:complete